jgi:hypothetical protein
VTRIFTTLAILAVSFMAATLIIGLLIGNLYDEAGKYDPTQEAQHLKTVHFLCGLACSMVVLLVNSVSITYFVGTSRWAKEVTAAYSLPGEYVERSTNLKRRCWPLAISGMVAMLGIVALGGAADPATGRAGTEWWATPHMLGALLGMTWISVAFVLQRNLIFSNYQVIGEVMQQVELKQKAAQAAVVKKTVAKEVGE